MQEVSPEADHRARGTLKNQVFAAKKRHSTVNGTFQLLDSVVCSGKGTTKFKED